MRKIVHLIGCYLRHVLFRILLLTQLEERRKIIPLIGGYLRRVLFRIVFLTICFIDISLSVSL